MSRRPRRNHAPAFEAKVALAAVRGGTALAELTRQFDVLVGLKRPAEKHFRVYCCWTPCLFGSPTIQLWEADRSALQARKMRFMLPLDVFKACKELFRNLCRPFIGVQLRHELDLPRHKGSTLADMAADHLQFGFFLSHALSRPPKETIGKG